MQTEYSNIAKLIKEYFNQRKIGLNKFFLFGSRARGDNDSNSDFDFLIVLEDNLKSNEKRRLKVNLYEYLSHNNSMLNMDLILKNKDDWDWESNNIGFLSYIVNNEGVLI